MIHSTDIATWVSPVRTPSANHIMSWSLRTLLNQVSSPQTTTRAVVIGTGIWFLTSTIVLLGLLMGVRVFKVNPLQGHKFDYAGEYYANWDGQWYKSIAQRGYFYDPAHHSSVAFFPAYPTLTQVVSRCTGMNITFSLIITSNACLIATLILLYRYVTLRYGDEPARVADWTLIALGLVPTGFFLRVAYSESTFLLVLTLFFYAIARQWRPIWVALIVGLITAARPTGIALLPALALYIWRRPISKGSRWLRLAYLLPLGAWGLAEYMIYLYMQFGEPLAFWKTQVNWALRPSPPWPQKALALLTMEPTRSLFDPKCPVYWATFEKDVLPVLSLHLADPVYFAGTMILVVAGALRRWLNAYECITALFLLLIPYVSNGYESYNRSFGRYALVVIPAYLVAGRLLAQLPRSLACAACALAGFLLGVYSAMFASWHFYM